MQACIRLGRNVALILVALALLRVAGAQEAAKPTGDCAGLHAGIAALVAQPRQGYWEPSVQVSFILLNDSETTLDTGWESWILVIDGNELKDMFHNGLGPLGGTLAPGANFSFTKALPIAKYFPEQREYKISWKGKYFQSPTATVRVPAEER